MLELTKGSLTESTSMTTSGYDGALPADRVEADVDLGEHTFALCLTHDVDRVYKTYQSIYEAMVERDLGGLWDLLPGRNPYWQFETVMAIEDDLGVRSAFYFLDEQYLFRDRPKRTWLSPEAWKLYLGRYSLTDPAVVDAIESLDEGGWEVGLHGSFESYRDPAMLQAEKNALEAVLGDSVRGGRQHYLNLEVPETWQHQRDVGLQYDTSLGASDDYGFRGRYRPIRPFGDEFVVFPLTLMELTLPAVTTDPEAAWAECESLLTEAREEQAVMTVLWHPSYFSDQDYPNYAALYRRLIERAQELGAWVGPPGALYDRVTDPNTRRAGTERGESVDRAPREGGQTGSTHNEQTTPGRT